MFMGTTQAIQLADECCNMVCEMHDRARRRQSYQSNESLLPALKHIILCGTPYELMRRFSGTLCRAEYIIRCEGSNVFCPVRRSVSARTQEK